MPSEIPSFLEITPFGPYCKLCNEPLTIQKGISNHGKKFHPDVSFKNATIIREVNNKLTKLRNVHSDDLTLFLKDTNSAQMVWFCIGCFTAFNKTSNYKRHLEVRNNNCTGEISGKVACYPTICGRLGPKICIATVSLATPTLVSVGTDVSSLTDTQSKLMVSTNHLIDASSKVPPALMTTQDDAAAILLPFVRADEDVRDLSLIYYPMLCPGFEGKIRNFIGYSEKNSVEDPILTNWIETGRLWLTNYAAGPREVVQNWKLEL